MLKEDFKKLEQDIERKKEKYQYIEVILNKTMVFINDIVIDGDILVLLDENDIVRLMVSYEHIDSLKIRLSNNPGLNEYSDDYIISFIGGEKR